MIPSKELLSEVLGLKVCEVVSITLEKNTDFMRLDYECIKILIDEGLANKQGLVRGYSVRYINIHELAHKCKEWALKQNHSLTSWAYKTDSAFCEIGSREDDDYMFFEATTEVEAIFKACEWIMEQTR